MMKKGEDADSNLKVFSGMVPTLIVSLILLYHANNKKPSCIIKCWMEPWDIEDLVKNDPASKERLLEIFSQFEWFDFSSNKMSYSDTNQAIWGGQQFSDEGGWLVKAYSEDWCKDDPDHQMYEKSFAIGNDSTLHDNLANYYQN